MENHSLVLLHYNFATTFGHSHKKNSFWKHKTNPLMQKLIAQLNPELHPPNKTPSFTNLNKFLNLQTHSDIFANTKYISRISTSKQTKSAKRHKYIKFHTFMIPLSCLTSSDSTFCSCECSTHPKPRKKIKTKVSKFKTCSKKYETKRKTAK